MQKAADEGHQACHEPAKERVAATGKRSVIGETFGEGHRDSCTHGGGRADQEDSARVVGGERCREDWRQRRDGAIHEAREPGLHDAQDKALVIFDDGREFAQIGNTFGHNLARSYCSTRRCGSALRLVGWQNGAQLVWLLAAASRTRTAATWPAMGTAVGAGTTTAGAAAA